MSDRFPSDNSDLEGSEERRMGYITSLIELAGEDARHVTLYVTVTLSAVLVVVTQLPFARLLDLPLGLRITLVLSTVCALLGAGGLFRYVQALHRTRMLLVRCLASADAPHARAIWAGEQGVWKRTGGNYLWGLRLTLLGGAGIVTVVACMLLAGD
ncbi:hypothetical protein [Streptomyces sp. NPDC048172]|uniref:hypothetical protein n=1 Tax=Streptomyces sp. NPDC048172 TaxID=3365505 RepID=UPI00371BF873